MNVKNYVFFPYLYALSANKVDHGSLMLVILDLFICVIVLKNLYFYCVVTS